QLVGVPAVVAGERQRPGAQAQGRARRGARDREQQGGVIARRVGDLAAEAGVVGGVHGRDSRRAAAAAAVCIMAGMANPPFPDTNTTLLIPGPAGVLEVAVDLPEP